MRRTERAHTTLYQIGDAHAHKLFLLANGLGQETAALLGQIYNIAVQLPHKPANL
jgi:hypothetical protein